MSARIRLCGRLEVELGGERVERRLPGRQGPLVLALLALNRTRPVPRDELIGALWPADLPADPEESLSALLSKVRQVVGRDVLTGRRELTLLLPDDAEVDVEQAFAASERAQAAAAAGDWGAARDDAAGAAETAGRGFLVGHDGPWVDERRQELDELRLRALELVAQAGVELGGAELPAAERAARELIAAAPLREAGHRLLMEALAARGEVAEALAAYEELRVLLRDELGMAPGAAVRELHERLLAGDAPRSRPAPAAAPARPPLPAPLAQAERGAFVGRASERAALREAWAAARDGRRGLAMLHGSPGIGKTRLAGELAREAHADGTVLYGACQEDELVSYQPFVEALRHFVRNAPDAVAAARLGPGAAELASLIPELPAAAAEASPAPDPETRRYLMFEAVAALLAAACAGGPVLLVLDDLHWADRSTLQLLHHLARAQDDAGLLIVGTYRDAEVGAGHPLAELLAELRRAGPLTRVALAGLDRSGVGELIEAHGGDAPPPELAQTVHSATDGNPFFVEEVVRHLLEGGTGVPEGVKEVLALRLSRLSESCRTVLANAAVLGREFGFEALATMAAVDDDTAIGALEEALGARLVLEQHGGSEPIYSFVHALVRETLYEELSAPRRQRMHAQAARAIEATAPDTDDRLAPLAVHTRLAGPAADAGQAIDYSLRAGDRARRLFAWDEALAHWDGALGVMERAGTDLATRGGLLVGVAEVCAVIGDIGRQIDYLERAIAVYDQLEDEERAAQVHSRLGQALSLIDSIDAEHLDVRRAFHHLEAAREVLERGPVRRSRGHLENGIAIALTYDFRVPPALEAAGRAMEIGEQVGDELLWTAAAQTYAWHSFAAGRLGEAADLLERTFEVADRNRRAFLAWMAPNTIGQMTWGLGSPTEAQGFLERPLGLTYMGPTTFRREIADGVGRCHLSRGETDAAQRLLPDARGAWITHSLRPLVDLWDGRWDEVIALAERVLEASLRKGNRWDEFGCHHLAGRVERLRGRPEPAIERLERALTITLDGGTPYFEMWVRPELARALAEAGRAGEAQPHLERVHAILAGGEDWRGRRGIAALAEAVVLSSEGRHDEAGAAFEAAHGTLRSYELVAERADCLHQWAVALRRAGDGSGADERARAAAELLAAHGAGRPWLERVEAA